MLYTLAQINPTVGALDENTQKILEVWKQAEGDLVIFPEMVICGYPPEDLVLKPAFLDEIENKIEYILEQSKEFENAALIGCPWHEDGSTYNAVHLIENGEIKATQYKHHLPNYGVFDEKRVFAQGAAMPDTISFRDTKLGLMICEDMWAADNMGKHFKAQDAEMLISINASPFTVKKNDIRTQIATKHTKETGLPMIYVNQIGGQDELVFDGGSFVMNEEGEIVHQLPFFEESIQNSAVSTKEESPEDEAIYKALCLGLHDYVTKNHFPGVLLGLSGGVDSALVAAIAVDALGADKVRCIMMPSPYTSQESLDDAEELAKNLGCQYESISIAEAMKTFGNTIPNLDGLAHENMQSRSRGLILMALSNQSGSMLLSTGNKSEMAVGYATLYGDMNGGFNVLKDIYKTKVYELCRWRNEQKQTIPERILTKAPSAELKDNQIDQDSLPDYDSLDAILEALIEKEMSIDDIVRQGYERDIVQRVWRMLDIAEYKRRQAPPGIVITDKAFGRDRRYPITNQFVKYIEKSGA